MRPRPALTLLELLVAVAILAVLVGVLLPAVQKVREAAARSQSANKLRQIGVGAHHYAEAHDGRLPGFVSPARPGREDVPPLTAVLPFVESRSQRYVPLFRSPADPTLPPSGPTTDDDGNTSYAVNAVGFQGRPTLAQFPDGCSTTVAVGEHYASCGPVERYAGPSGGRYNFFFGLLSSPFAVSNPNPYLNLIPQSRRATFADAYHADVLPVTIDGVTLPSRPGATFQVAPRPVDADPLLPQTPHPGGMLTLLFDGSVRTVRGGVDPSAFGAAVTRDGGETTPLD